MSDALLLLPDFLLIVCGFLLCRYTALNRTVWEQAERLVYYLLFPVLLFNSIVRSPLEFRHHLAAGDHRPGARGAAASRSAYALKRVPGVDPKLHASGAQVAFRFNSYMALALAEKLGGPDGVTWIALLVALCVPICNFAAV